MIADDIKPKKITDLIDKIDLYLEEMRKQDNLDEVPMYLNSYAWNFFRDVNPDTQQLQSLSVFVADHIYRYAAAATLTDNFTRKYFASVVSTLLDTLQSRGVDTFYILDNEIREDRLLLTIQLFALAGVAVVTPYVIKENYHKYMSAEEQMKWVLSFTIEECDAQQLSITIDMSEELRKMEVLELISKYMEHSRNIVYIEKDESVNYLEDVTQLAKKSKYMSILRNRAPEEPLVTVINQ